MVVGIFLVKYFYEKWDKLFGLFWDGFFDWCVENIDDDDDK